MGLATYGSVWLSSLLLDGLFAALRQEQWQNAPTYRLSKRLSTFAGVSKGVTATTLVLLGSLVGLASVGVNIGPLVASLGFIGLGISLAAQDLIKDVINGLLILLEDQFAEGDVIVVDGRGGLVEHMDLRLTQLRNTEGSLISIPNSAIRVVENLSNGWSRVDLGIVIAYENDLEQAIRITEQVALQMYREPAWRDKILEPPRCTASMTWGSGGSPCASGSKCSPYSSGGWRGNIAVASSMPSTKPGSGFRFRSKPSGSTAPWRCASRASAQRRPTACCA